MTGHLTHRWPQVLKGGASVLFTASDNGLDFEAADLEVVSIKDRQIKKVWQGSYFGRYLPSGHLIFIHESTLFAVPFDIGRLQTTGAAAPVLVDVYSTPQFGGSQIRFLSERNFCLCEWPRCACGQVAARVDGRGG